MDLSEHRATFSMFMKATEWGSALIIASVGMFTVAFAMGLGWFAGLGVFVAVGVLAGALLRMGAAWWATVAIITVLCAVGGGLVSLLVPAKKAAALALLAFA
jgi:hypothetical protein